MAFYLNVFCDSGQMITQCHEQLQGRQEQMGSRPAQSWAGRLAPLLKAGNPKNARSDGGIARVSAAVAGVFAGGKAHAEAEAQTDAFCQIACDLTRRAVAHFGYFCEVEDLFGQGLFSVILVKNLKLDQSRSGFCYLPTSVASMMWRTCGADIHGEHDDQRGFEYGTSRCGFTLPIAMEHIAELVMKLAQTTYERSPLSLRATPKRPEQQRQYLAGLDPKSFGSFSNVELPGLDLDQGARVYALRGEDEDPKDEDPRQGHGHVEGHYYDDDGHLAD